jgi:hypothetical protein
LTKSQYLALAIVLGYVLGDMVGLEKSDCIYLACILSVIPMLEIVGDIFKKSKE